MNISDDMLFEIKSKMIKLSLETKEYEGVYFPASHSIDLNLRELSYPKAVITYIHELIHMIYGNGLIGILQEDFSNLFLLLVTYYEETKETLLQKYLSDNNMKIIDSSEMEKYLIINYHEINKYLSTHKEYINYIKFCLEIYYLFKTLVFNSKFINESLATYLSLNITPEHRLYHTLNLNDFFYDKSIITEIREEQEKEKRQLLELNNNIYSVSYIYTQKLVEIYGEEIMLCLGDLIMGNIPFYNFDLIGCTHIERQKYFNKYYNLDKKWLNLLNIDSDSIKEYYSDIKKYEIKLYYAVCGFAQTDLPELEKLNNSYDYTFKYAFMHPKVIEEITKILGEKPTKYNILLKLKDAYKLKHTNEINPIAKLMHDKIDEKIIDERIKKFPKLIKEPKDRYTNILMNSIVKTMEAIVALSK